MGRLKRKSAALPEALKRLAGLKSISSNLDLGKGLTLEAYRKVITQMETLLEQYNKVLSDADAALNKVLQMEKDLSEYSRRMLAAVGAVYGYDSNEYEMAGGTRVSERKKPGTADTSGERESET